MWPLSQNSMAVHPYYPLYFDIEGRLCAVIGGGNVAERKVRALLAAGARIKVISPLATERLLRLGRSGSIELVQREYRSGDLKGATLAFAATDSSETNDQIRQEARRSGILLNVVDKPDLCDFIVPSIVRRGPITIAISTSGLLPMLSKRLRKEIAEKLSSDFVLYARRVAAFRAFVLEHIENPTERRRIMMRIEKLNVSAVARMTLKEMKERFITQAPSRPPRKKLKND